MRILSPDHPEAHYQVHLVIGFPNGTTNDLVVGFETEKQASDYFNLGRAMGEHFQGGGKLEYLEIKRIK